MDIFLLRDRAIPCCNGYNAIRLTRSELQPLALCGPFLYCCWPYITFRNRKLVEKQRVWGSPDACQFSPPPFMAPDALPIFVPYRWVRWVVRRSEPCPDGLDAAPSAVLGQVGLTHLEVGRPVSLGPRNNAGTREACCELDQHISPTRRSLFNNKFFSQGCHSQASFI